MILFLDFDGVLHPAVPGVETQLFSRRALLEEVLRLFPAVPVVISSTWRETRTIEEIQQLFSADIAARIIGVTPHWRDVQDDSTMGSYVRQAEIEAWLRQEGRPWEDWVALDDQPWLFRPFLPNLVTCDPGTGITEDAATQLRSKLWAS